MHPSDRIRGSWSDHLAGRRIVLAVAGSIAAVRTVELARSLIRHGADVKAVMTPAAMRIVHPDALEFATGSPPITGLSGAVEHVTELGAGGDADLFLVAPATANTIAKMALGIDDTALTTFAAVGLGSGRPVMVAPAMHGVMEENPATKEHIQKLKERGVAFVPPLYEEGKAKLAPVDAITDCVLQRLGPGTLNGRRVLLVAGRSEEAVDTVRVLSNRSSGATGHALARALFRHGARVSVVTSLGEAGWPPGTKVHPFVSLRDLTRDLPGLLAEQDPHWVLMPAALADFIPQRVSHKLSSDEKAPTLRLERAAKVLPLVREHAPDTRIVSWKLEDTLEKAVEAARTRLSRQRIDAVVANAAVTLGAEITHAVLVTAEDETPLSGSKDEVAERIVQELAGRFAGPSGKARSKMTTRADSR